MKGSRASKKKVVSDAKQQKISCFFKPKSSHAIVESAQTKPIEIKDDCKSDLDPEIIPPTPIEKRQRSSAFSRSNGSSRPAKSMSAEIPDRSIFDSGTREKRPNHIDLFDVIPPSQPSYLTLSSPKGIIQPMQSPLRSQITKDDDIISPTQQSPRVHLVRSNHKWSAMSGNLDGEGLSFTKRNSTKRPLSIDIKSDSESEHVGHVIVAPRVSQSPVAKHSRIFSSSLSHSRGEFSSIREEINSAITESIVQLDIGSDSISDEREARICTHVDEAMVEPSATAEIALLQSKVGAADIKRCPIEAESRSNNHLVSRFGRHVVDHVINSVDSRGRPTKELFLKSNDEQPQRRCILKGFWGETRVRDDDVVNVLADFDCHTNTVVLDDDDPTNAGLLIVNPDRLVSGTAIVSTLFCQRKALFNEWFRGLDSSNALMFVGTVIHQLFQDSVKKRLRTQLDVQKHLEVLLSRPKYLVEMYKYQNTYSPERLTAECSIFIPKIVDWIAKHSRDESAGQEKVLQGTGDLSSKASNTLVVSVHDIEENVWSPRLGVKGRIDLTVEVAVHSRWNGFPRPQPSTKVMALEIKTGRSSFSVEHCGQVTLYSLMSEDRRPDPGAGLLLYIRDGQMREIPSDIKNRRGLIQRRNELISFLTSPLMPLVPDAHEVIQTPIPRVLGQLPRPLGERRLCEKCPYLTTCAVRHRVIESGETLQSSHPFLKLAADETAHLGSDDFAYFSDWCSWIFLESLAADSRSANAKDIWCLTSQEREKRGECFSDMVLVGPPSSKVGEGRYLHTFVRSPTTCHLALTPLSQVGLTSNQSVAVSVESSNLVALATGFVDAATDSSIRLLLDRDIYEKREWRKATYRIDAYSSQSVITTCLSNVARLMGVTAELKRLREIVVGRREASFEPKMGKDCVLKGKLILRSLNKEQKKAVLKTLMTKDYLLIKGMPGTGKTATIVALVRLLHEMSQTVLLVSHTHAAVDNVLLKLKASGLHFLRLGSSTRIHPDLHDYTEESMLRNVTSLRELNDLLNSKSVVATTCLGSNHAFISQGRIFDYCIVDEASQVLQPICLGPLFRCRKFILVGDHDQLPPVVQSIDAKNLGFDESIFARLYSPQSMIELTIQYRMNREITRLANVLTYKGALKCATEDVANGVLQLPNRVDSNNFLIKSALNSELDKSVIFVNTDGIEASQSRDPNGQLYNVMEAQIVVRLIYAFLQAGLKASNLGVICPFKKQVAHVISTLRNTGLLLDDVLGVEINTVDQYQGREKEVILLSCVKSGGSAATVLPSEILSDRRRINVAITRACRKLILIGSESTMRRYEPMQTLIEALRPEQTIRLSPGDFDEQN